jgi:hypothetical protein
VKKLRRKEICSHQAANVYLEREYLPEHNGRFARAAAKGEDWHRRAPRAEELDGIFRLHSERVMGNDGVVRYQNRWLQIEGPSRASARKKVTVWEGRHGGLAIEYAGRAQRWWEIAAPRKPRKEESKPATERVLQRQAGRNQRKWVPPANHPWRARRGVKERPLKQAAAAGSSLALPSAAP